MPFAKLNVANAEPAKASKSKVPVYRISSEVVSQLNNASAQLEDAKARYDMAYGKVQDIGVRELLKRNVQSPMTPLSSIKVEDSTGNDAMVTMTSRYKQCDANVACDLFENELHVPVTRVARNTIKASFDSKVFLNAAGQFDQAKYDAFNKAIAAVAKSLNVENPLSSKEVVEPLDNFHEIRWQAFPTVDDQLKIQERFPCTVQIRPGDYVKGEDEGGTPIAPSLPA